MQVSEAPLEAAAASVQAAAGAAPSGKDGKTKKQKQGMRIGQPENLAGAQV
jgi:hypothetical protein